MPDSLTDAERFPLLTEVGRRLLQWLREHPHAPRYTAQSGNRLTAGYLRRVRAFEAELNAAPRGWQPGATPPWLADFVDIPALDRGDLSREPWSFVPDPLPLDDLIINATSGTTGHPLVIPSHPVVGACYLPLLKIAVEMYGLRIPSLWVVPVHQPQVSSTVHRTWTGDLFHT